MNSTARELADQVAATLRKSWDKVNPTVAVVSTEQLNPEDEATVERVVAAEGYTGEDRKEMVRKVSALLVGRVEALADHMPADNGD